jgi:hypothetical protein
LRSFYHKNDASTSEFIQLNEAEARSLSQQQGVLRLLEGKSSQLTGWKGVSILFASLGLVGMNKYAKVESFTYIVPVWSLDELQYYNRLLDGGLN